MKRWNIKKLSKEDNNAKMALYYQKTKVWGIEFLISFFFLILLFAPPFRQVEFLPKYSWVLAAAGLLTLLDGDFREHIHFLTTRSLALWGVIGLGAVCACLIPILHGTWDFSYIPLYIGLLFSMLRAVLLVYVLFKRSPDNIMENLCRYFLNICVIYVCFTLIFAFIPSIRDFWLDKVLYGVIRSDYHAYVFRYSIDGFSAFHASTSFAFAALIAGYAIAREQKISYVLLAKYVFIAIGCCFYGRISFVGLGLSFVIIFTAKGQLKKNLGLLWRGTIVISVFLLLVEVLSMRSASVAGWKNWAFDIFRQIVVEGEITDYSFAHMFKDMYFLPKASTLFLGDGLYTDPGSQSYYMHTDVGYMRTVLYGGLPFLLISYAAWLYMSWCSFKVASTMLEKTLVVLLVVLWGVMEMKGEAYMRYLYLSYPFYLALVSRQPRQKERIPARLMSILDRLSIERGKKNGR